MGDDRRQQRDYYCQDYRQDSEKSQAAGPFRRRRGGWLDFGRSGGGRL
jgi:hypothetical protein